MKICLIIEKEEKRKKQKVIYEPMEKVCPDFKDMGASGVMWICLFIPIVGPLVYLAYYYFNRRPIKRSSNIS
jgi:hypothetical protein